MHRRRELGEPLMASHWLHATLITSILAIALTITSQALPATAGVRHGPRPVAAARCSAGPAPCHGSALACTRTPETAATRASTPTSTWSTTRPRTGSCREPCRPHRPGYPVPDQLQPGPRAQVRQRQGRPGPDGPLRRGQRPPASFAFAQPAFRRPARAERPQPAGARGVAAQPGGRPAAQSAAARLLAGADVHQPGDAELHERHAVPGEQAGDHAPVPDRRRVGLHA